MTVTNENMTESDLAALEQRAKAMLTAFPSLGLPGEAAYTTIRLINEIRHLRALVCALSSPGNENPSG